MKAIWDERYSEAGFAYGTAPNDFLASHYQSLPLGRILCLAEGEGRNGCFLAAQGYQVTALDQSSVGLAKAKELAQTQGVHLETLVADLADYSIETAAWDGIVSIWAHLPAPLRQKVHLEVVQGLKPGGVFLLEAYTPKQLEMPGVGGPPVSQMLMELATLRTELLGLDFVLAQEIEREVQEGQYHQGLSAVVQLIARKPV